MVGRVADANASAVLCGWLQMHKLVGGVLGCSGAQWIVIMLVVWLVVMVICWLRVDRMYWLCGGWQ